MKDYEPEELGNNGEPLPNIDPDVLYDTYIDHLYDKEELIKDN